jgi:hypothetical protein
LGVKFSGYILLDQRVFKCILKIDVIFTSTVYIKAMGFIYRISHKNKSYIGQTRRPYEERWNQHKNSIKDISINRPLVDALRVIGIEHFVF